MLLFKQIIFLFLAFAVFIQQGSKTFILIDYCINKKYIATVLCENRNRPQCHCNGKCHLRKELKKDDERQGNEKQSLNEKQEIYYWENHSSSDLIFMLSSDKTLKAPASAQCICSVELPSPFHPPCE
ncbi:MAG TPA: hypothetical protein VFJ43_12175 [Bacteroidia bacterium]|nr:hypothetical protein [Bacteroidia bacterium]